MIYANVSQIAFRDIAEYLKAKYKKYNLPRTDHWVVSTMQLNTKEQRRLNKMLGICSINHLGNTNWINNPFFKGTLIKLKK